jgi:hypothetical protein
MKPGFNKEVRGEPDSGVTGVNTKPVPEEKVYEGMNTEEQV